jgi:CRP/FNR family transcriptional regulator, cyclic AMP receptor protein
MAMPDFLRACPLFHELFDKEIEKIAKRATVHTFEEGDSIIKDGEEGDEIFVLLQGGAMVQKEAPNGIIKIQPLNPGDVFGELVLLDIRTRSADIVATTESHILELKYGDIFELYKKEPKIFGLLILNLARLLASRLRNASETISKMQKTAA